MYRFFFFSTATGPLLRLVHLTSEDVVASLRSANHGTQRRWDARPQMPNAKCPVPSSGLRLCRGVSSLTMPLYTRKGDGGYAALPGGRAGTLVPKDDPRIVALGEVDELIAFVGSALCEARRVGHERIAASLALIEDELMRVCSGLAAIGGGGHSPVRLTDSPGRFEREIDAIFAGLPPLTHFVLSGGCELEARLHLARTVCRRAERAVTTALGVSGGTGFLPVYEQLPNLFYQDASGPEPKPGSTDVQPVPAGSTGSHPVPASRSTGILPVSPTGVPPVSSSSSSQAVPPPPPSPYPLPSRERGEEAIEDTAANTAAVAPESEAAAILRYVNRLSDYLFALARQADADAGGQERIWEPR
jgi:cob(I)alamin adenosyltransferase